MWRSVNTVILRRVLTKNSIGNYEQITRHLYASNTIGIDGYLYAREKIQGQLANSIDKFRSKMQEFVEDASSKNMIFTEDLKNMVHVVEKSDLDLVVKMIEKFHSQNKELRFGNFVFGPIVMRMFYNFNDDENALKCFRDPKLAGFFDQIISYHILMDLLYEKKKYQEVLNTFDEIKARQVQGGKYPKHVVVLTLAACYKLNTPESFQYALGLWKELNDVGHIPMRKSATFIAGLALLQNAAHIALEILTTIRQQNYLTVRNLKVVALCELNRPDDALPVLRSVLEVDVPGQKKQTFFREVIDKVKESVERSPDKELKNNFNRVEKFLVDQGHITNDTLDQLLCSEITSTGTSERKEKSVLAASFSKGGNQRYQDNNSQNRFNSRRPNRPGLNDLY